MQLMCMQFLNHFKKSFYRYSFEIFRRSIKSILDF